MVRRKWNSRPELFFSDQADSREAERRISCERCVRRTELRRSKIFHEIGEPVHWIVVVRRARTETQLQIQPVSRCHRFRNGIEIYGSAPRGYSAAEHFFRKRASQPQPAAPT